MAPRGSVRIAAAALLTATTLVALPRSAAGEGVAELDEVVYYETEFGDENLPPATGPVDGIRGLDDVVVSPDGKHAYATGSLDDSIAIFGRDTTTGLLTYLGTVTQSPPALDAIDFVQHIALSPDGKHLYAAGQTGALAGTVAVFSRHAATGALTFVEKEEDGVGGVTGIAGAQGVTVSPDGGHVYATGWLSDGVASFARDTGTGALTFVESEINGTAGVTGMDRPQDVAVSPDGEHVYVVAGSSGDGSFPGSEAIVTFGRDASTGALVFVESLTDGGVDGSGNTVNGLFEVANLDVSPDGKHVYTAAEVGAIPASPDDDWLGVFARDAATGKLTFVEAVSSPIDTSPCGFSFSVGVEADIKISPDGTLAYAVDNRESALVEFDRDSVTGVLTGGNATCRGANFTGAVFDETVSGLSSATAVDISPDGKHVYVGSFSPSAVNVFGPPSTISIAKELTPDGSATFPFTLGGDEMLATPFGPLGDGGSTTFQAEPGDYTVVEDAVAGYGLTGLVCTDPTGDTTVDLGAREATIALAIEETVSCTFTNEPTAIAIDSESLVLAGGDRAIAVLLEGSARVRTRRTSDGSQVSHVGFGDFEPIDLEVIPDPGGDPDLAVLGMHPAGVAQVRVKDSVTGALLGVANFGSVFVDDLDLEIVGGDVAVMGTHTTSGAVIVHTKQVGGAPVSIVKFGPKYSGTDLEVTSGNMAVLGTHASGAVAVRVRTPAGAQVGAASYGDKYSGDDLEMVGSDLAVLGTHASGAVAVRLRSQAGAAVGAATYGAAYSGDDLEIVGGDLAVLGTDTGGAVAVRVRTVAGAPVGAAYYGSSYAGEDLEITSGQLAVLGTRTSDGAIRVQVRTKADVKKITLHYA